MMNGDIAAFDPRDQIIGELGRRGDAAVAEQLDDQLAEQRVVGRRRSRHAASRRAASAGPGSVDLSRPAAARRRRSAAACAAPGPRSRRGTAPPRHGSSALSNSRPPVLRTKIRPSRLRPDLRGPVTKVAMTGQSDQRVRCSKAARLASERRKSSSLSATGQCERQRDLVHRSAPLSARSSSVLPLTTCTCQPCARSAAWKAAASPAIGDPHHRGAAEREAGGDRRGDAVDPADRHLGLLDRAGIGRVDLDVEGWSAAPVGIGAAASRSASGVLGVLLERLGGSGGCDDHQGRIGPEQALRRAPGVEQRRAAARPRRACAGSRRCSRREARSGRADWLSGP